MPEKGVQPNNWQTAFLEQYLNESGTEKICDLYGEHKWAYMSSKKYLGDSWWFDDKEILKDVQKMNTIEFLEKYKGY